MPTGHGDGAAICRLEDSSRFGQPFSFLRCSGWRARRRLSPPPNSAQARAKPLVLLPPIRAQRSPFALLSSLFYPHVANVSSAQERATLRLLKGDGNIGGIVHSDALS